MTHTRNKIRTAIVALSASVVLPLAPVYGQEPVTIAPPPPVTAAPPPPVSTAPPPVINITPVEPVATRAPAATPTRTTRAARPAAQRARAEAPVRRAAPAPAPAAAPAPAPVAEPVAPVAETVAPPAPLPVETPVIDESRTGAVETGGTGSILPWLLIGAALLIGAFAFFALRRRRRAAYGYDETYIEEPAVYEEPVAPEPSIARATPVEPAPVIAAAAEPAREIEEPTVAEADDADVEALAAESAPVSGRPWLEFLMRPIRAGTSHEDAIVQFELTVGNTGSVAATDVKVSTWMVAAGQASEMERSLIETPASAQVSEFDIAAGDGARVEAEVALSKSGLGEEPVLPVVVADARYTLPDGSEGRTHAAFAVGLPGDDEALTPFPVDRSSGLIENVEARLHGEPERV